MRIDYLNEKDWVLTRNRENLRIDRRRWYVNRSVIFNRWEWYDAFENYADRLTFNLVTKRIKHLIKISI